MRELLSIHPDNPQMRLIRRVILALKNDQVVVYPTDSGYALGCRLGSKAAQIRVRQIRELPPEHVLTVLCKDLSSLSSFARVSRAVFRLLKAHTPGPYTFILEAKRDLPRYLKHPRYKTVGLRVPNSPIVQAILGGLDEPLLNVTVREPESEAVTAQQLDIDATDAQVIDNIIGSRVDMIVDGGFCPIRSTSIVNLSVSPPVIIRKGEGDVTAFLDYRDER